MVGSRSSIVIVKASSILCSLLLFLSLAGSLPLSLSPSLSLSLSLSPSLSLSLSHPTTYGVADVVLLDRVHHRVRYAVTLTVTRNHNSNLLDERAKRLYVPEGSRGGDEGEEGGEKVKIYR